MKCESFKQYAIVKADSAAEFTDLLNAEMKRLSKKYPVPSFSDSDPFYARISYTESVRIPETLADEYELEGVKLRCKDCPFFEPIRRADGKEDGRCKKGDCEHAKYGMTFRTSKMCDVVFEMLNEGKVKLCLAD